jgi:hypothetical protein
MATLLICLFSLVSFGQKVSVGQKKSVGQKVPVVQKKSVGQTDSVYLIKEIDEMTGEGYIFTNRDFVVANEDKTVGFKIRATIGGDLSVSSLTVEMAGIGGCNENDEIIILFENGEKITMTSWKKFNCEGIAYFDPNENEIKLLKTQPMSKIRMTNGRSYDSYTGDVKQKDKRYFIQFYYAVDNNLITDKKK